MTYHGEENAQLDSLQQVLPREPVGYPRLTSVANLIMWSLPRVYLTQLEDLFTNNQVITDQWAAFMSSCLRDWSTSISWVRGYVLYSDSLA